MGRAGGPTVTESPSDNQHLQDRIMTFAQAVENSNCEGINDLATFLNQYNAEIDGWMGDERVATYRQNYYQLISDAQFFTGTCH